MIQSNFNMHGELYITLTDANGEIKQEQSVPNLVVQTGKEYIAQRIASNTAPLMNYMAVGTSSVAPGTANTALLAEIAASRVTIGAANTSTTSNTTTYVATFPASVGTGAITEAGIFNASSGGTMLCRTTFPVVNKGALDTLSITWSVSAL